MENSGTHLPFLNTSLSLASLDMRHRTQHKVWIVTSKCIREWQPISVTKFLVDIGELIPLPSQIKSFLKCEGLAIPIFDKLRLYALNTEMEALFRVSKERSETQAQSRTLATILAIFICIYVLQMEIYGM
ncbi:hypothetical protein HAX54_026781 [Datura stramonium]|uniref:Uncharacterized protein n=1 Tax=Datura stramonium TaxID=4076 RepID=A0ABS8V1I1_DATST|nr:hypothetical protein [Datura stramonium]